MLDGHPRDRPGGVHDGDSPRRVPDDVVPDRHIDGLGPRHRPRVGRLEHDREAGLRHDPRVLEHVGL